jgi:hypothetical protein
MSCRPAPRCAPHSRRRRDTQLRPPPESRGADCPGAWSHWPRPRSSCCSPPDSRGRRSRGHGWCGQSATSPGILAGRRPRPRPRLEIRRRPNRALSARPTTAVRRPKLPRLPMATRRQERNSRLSRRNRPSPRSRPNRRNRPSQPSRRMEAGAPAVMATKRTRPRRQVPTARVTATRFRLRRTTALIVRPQSTGHRRSTTRRI